MPKYKTLTISIVLRNRTTHPINKTLLKLPDTFRNHLIRNLLVVPGERPRLAMSFNGGGIAVIPSRVQVFVIEEGQLISQGNPISPPSPALTVPWMVNPGCFQDMQFTCGTLLLAQDVSYPRLAFYATRNTNIQTNLQVFTFLETEAKGWKFSQNKILPVFEERSLTLTLAEHLLSKNFSKESKIAGSSLPRVYSRGAYLFIQESDDPKCLQQYRLMSNLELQKVEIAKKEKLSLINEALPQKFVESLIPIVTDYMGPVMTSPAFFSQSVRTLSASSMNAAENKITPNLHLSPESTNLSSGSLESESSSSTKSCLGKMRYRMGCSVS